MMSEDFGYDLNIETPLFDGSLAIVCMPNYRLVEPITFETLVIGMSKFGREKLRYMSEEKTCIWDARNKLAERFLKTDAEWMLFCDGDMAYPCGNGAYFNHRLRLKTPWPDRWAGINYFARMLNHPKHMLIVGATYFDRTFGTQIQCSRGCGSQREPSFTADWQRGDIKGVKEIMWTATGAMRIHRSVFEIMKQQAPKRFPEIVPHGNRTKHGYFTPTRVDLGEDVAFCLRARECNIKTYQDYDCRVAHKGDDWK